jgi:hypothetical protein
MTDGERETKSRPADAIERDLPLLGQFADEQKAGREVSARLDPALQPDAPDTGIYTAV